MISDQTDCGRASIPEKNMGKYRQSDEKCQYAQIIDARRHTHPIISIYLALAQI
jgi:hypothetical protein